MKKKRVKSLTSPNKPEGHGSASDSRSHKPEGHGSASDSRSHNPEKAKEYAFLLLKFRLRSEKELAQRLRQKGFSEELSQETVNFLKDKHFIDDRVFARGWVSSRLKRPFGLRRIKQELMQKGLDKQVIEEAFVQAKEDYDETGIVKQLAEQRLAKLKNIEPLKAKARVYAYLMRRGFSPDLISNVLRK
ncbi:MAG: regulatory protein RecX [Candidatus Omnitrophica bacterium]|nr:regulatory protein RecX [Candidatus Omnitrophota bacterium]